MNTSIETHDGLAATRAARFENPAAAAPRPIAQDRHPFSALPLGWTVVGRCRSGTGGPRPHATGCYVLAHPEVGVALIDIAPNATPNAEARLRRALAAVDFQRVSPGTLPVVHERVDGVALRSLGWVLERSFAALPALTVPGGAAWIEGVRRAMAADSAWELPGQPKAAPDAPPAPASGADAAADTTSAAPRSKSASPRRRGRAAALPLAFAGTFAVGLVSGFLLLDSEAPVASPPPVVASAPQPPAAAALTAAAASPEAAPRPADATAAATAAATASATAVPTAVPAAAPAAAPVEAPRQQVEATAPVAPSVVTAALPSPAPRPASPAGEAPAGAVEVADVQQVAGPAASAAGASGPPSSLETRLSHAVPMPGEALPMAPPRAPTPPIRVSATSQQPARTAPARATPGIDRACSRALFRFQQGERLTAAEQNFIRSGCSTARR